MNGDGDDDKYKDEGSGGGSKRRGPRTTIKEIGLTIRLISGPLKKARRPKTSILLYIEQIGSFGIAPTRNCTYICKIGFLVAGGGFFDPIIYTKGKN